jgi:hypothetical protein
MTKKKKKHAGGRPSKYNPQYCEEIIRFFSPPFYETKVLEKGHSYHKTGEIKSEWEKKTEVPKPLRFFSAFARKIGVADDTLTEWTHKHPEFSVAYKVAKKLQEEHLVACALQNQFQSSFSIFTAKNILGWRDESHQRHSGEIRNPTPFTVILDGSGRRKPKRKNRAHIQAN